MLFPRRIRALAILTLLLGVVYTVLLAPRTSAQADPECKHIAIVFLRGSGQNQTGQYLNNMFDSKTFGQVEKESYSFFNWFKNHLDTEYPNVTYKVVSVHDFPGEYDHVGYQAAAIGFPLNADNSINAEASWFPGDYRTSVEHGIAETVGYLREQITSCPDQVIAVGGYSQGAQVMGESLFQLTPTEQEKIVGVGLFGDPKYIGSSRSLNPFSATTSYPWRRGDATNKDTGMLDPREPYVPTGLEKRTASYCMKTDIVCAGWSGARVASRAAHGSYSQEPMRHTVAEIMQWAAPSLAAAERSHGGLGTGGPTDPTPAQLAKARDVMFLLNDDSGDTVLQTFRYNLDPVLWPHTMQYANTQYGLKGFGEGEQNGQSLPRVNSIQALLPYVGYNPALPLNTSSNLAQAVAARYPFAQPQMGGGDYADPHGLAIERSVFSGGWREDAEKHLVIITDRPAKQTYSYNICNASVRSWLQVPNTNGYEACYTNFGYDVWPKVQHPEFCETVFLSITSDSCTNPLQMPGYTQFNTRTLADGIKAAQAQNIVVDIVVPYKITDPYNQFGVDNMLSGLRGVAAATGGKFIYYDQRTQYDQILLGDTLRQIFTHDPTNITFLPSTGNTYSNQPTVFSVSGNTHYVTYKWDFDNNGSWDDETNGPVVQTTYPQNYSGFVRVMGVNSGSSEGGEGLLPIEVTGAPAATDLPVVPKVTGVTAANGDITLTWYGLLEGDLIAIDPGTGLVVATVPTNSGQLVFTPEQPYTELEVVLATEEGVSGKVTVEVAPYTAPPEDLPDDVVADPTLCYKLQTCVTDPRPLWEDAAPSRSTTQPPVLQPASVVERGSGVAASATNTQVAGVSDTKQLADQPQAFPDVASNTAQPVRETADRSWQALILAIVVGAMLAIRQAIRRSRD